MISRAESAAAVSSVWPAKNTNAVSMMANKQRQERHRNQTEFHRAAPSCRRISRRVAAIHRRQFPARANIFVMFLHVFQF